MNSSILWILSVTLFIPFFTLLLVKKRVGGASRGKLPPGPKKLPLIGNLHQLSASIHRSLLCLSNQYGPLMFLKLGSVPTLVVSSADAAKEILKTHDQIFSNRPFFYAANKLGYEGRALSFAPYGEYWREMRKILVVELLSAKRVQSFEAVRVEEVKSMIDFIASSKGIINLSHTTLSLSNRVICRVAFDMRDDETIEFHDSLTESQLLVGEFNISDYFPWMGWINKVNGFDARLENNFRKFDRFLDMVIEKHSESNRTRSVHEDIVDVLLQIQKDPSRESPLHNNYIKGFLIDLFVAGTDTSAATLVWIMTELMRNPSAMRKAQEEVREVAKGKDKLDESDIPKFEYLKLVIKETMRLHPPAPLLIPRESTESCEIEGYTIPAKTRVFINATAIGLDPKYWEDPNEFKPERFLHSSVDFKGQNYELIPFGAGRRRCPGMGFATQLVELALANLLHSFDWALPPGMTAGDIDMEEALGIVVSKKAPLWLVATPAKCI